MVPPLESAGVCISARFMYVGNYFHNLVGKNYSKILQFLTGHRFHRKQCSNTSLQASPMRSHEPVVSQHLLDISWWNREAVLALTAAAHSWEHSAPVRCGQCCTFPWNTGLVGSYIPFGCKACMGNSPTPSQTPSPGLGLGMSSSRSRQHGLSQGELLLAHSLIGKRLDQSTGSPTLCRNHAVKPRKS